MRLALGESAQGLPWNPKSYNPAIWTCPMSFAFRKARRDITRTNWPVLRPTLREVDGTVRTWRTFLWNADEIVGRVKAGEPLRPVSIFIVDSCTLSNRHVLGCAHNTLHGESGGLLSHKRA